MTTNRGHQVTCVSLRVQLWYSEGLLVKLTCTILSIRAIQCALRIQGKLCLLMVGFHPVQLGQVQLVKRPNKSWSCENSAKRLDLGALD